MTLSEAITIVETKATALESLDSTKAAAQAKYEAALVAKDTADSADAVGETEFNAALDQLVAVAQASKRGTTPPIVPGVSFPS